MKINERLAKAAWCGGVVVVVFVTVAWQAKTNLSQDQSAPVRSARDAISGSSGEGLGSKPQALSRHSPDKLLAMRRRLAYYRSLVPSQEEMIQEKRRELKNHAENLLNQAVARGNWSESDAVNLFAIHEQLDEEEVHESLERLQSLLAAGQLQPQSAP